MKPIIWGAILGVIIASVAMGHSDVAWVLAALTVIYLMVSFVRYFFGNPKKLGLAFLEGKLRERGYSKRLFPEDFLNEIVETAIAGASIRLRVNWKHPFYRARWNSQFFFELVLWADEVHTYFTDPHQLFTHPPHIQSYAQQAETNFMYQLMRKYGFEDNPTGRCS